MSDDLAVRIRDYARGRLEKRLFADGEVAVSSAWLAREFDVDPRTIAAALRPFGVRPGEVERGVRGYLIADLAALDAHPVVSPSPPGGAADGVPAVHNAAGAPSAVDVLSAGAGHDMTPALRAAGLL